ncbi:MAG: acyl-CoA dehydrogenase family protein [Haloechinothrix sp.]
MSTNLLYTVVEEDLRASVRDLLTDRCKPAELITRSESDQPVDLRLWRTLAADLGVTSLSVPETLGGHGASAREIAVVMEELGRSVAPVPFLGSAVLATSALLGCEPSDEVAELLKALAGGDATAAFVVPFSVSVAGAHVPTVHADGAVLTGDVRTVADALTADLLIVPAVGVDGLELHAVRVADGAVAVSPVVSLDQTRPIADISLDRATSTLLASRERAESAVHAALLTGAGLLASEQVGIAEWCLDTTVGYVKQRYQFGRPVGSFQAVKHRLADLWQEIALARAVARYAADTLATNGDDARIAVSVAQSLCATVAVHAAEECVQLHGGIGMTWEHPAHLYLKRAKADQIALGTPGRHRALLASLIDLPPAS